jgi:hypothetical protein
MWTATYLLTLCHTPLVILITLAPNAQFVSPDCALPYASVRGGTVPDFRPVTNIRVAPKWGKNGVKAHIITGHPLFSPHPPSIPSPVIMAIQKEPGQKGVSWSNIAVGMYAFFTLLDPR